MPSEFGVHLYEHENFNGDGYGWHNLFTAGMHTGDFPNDVVTSYKIDSGCCATFFELYEYKGNSFAKCGPIESNVPDDWNDTISSMKVDCPFDRNSGSGKEKLDKETADFLDQLYEK